MKFQIYDEYSSQDKLKKKVKTPVTRPQEEIEKLCKELFNKKVDNKNIFGYVIDSKENLALKFDKNQEIYIVFSLDNAKIKRQGEKTWREYTSEKAFSYQGELP